MKKTHLDPGNLRARHIPPAERILMGSHLFDFWCALSKAGLPAENPHATGDKWRELLRLRLAITRKLSDLRLRHGILINALSRHA